MLTTMNVGNYLKSMKMQQKPYGPPLKCLKFEVYESSEAHFSLIPNFEG